MPARAKLAQLARLVNLPSRTTDFRVEAHLRLGRRHRLRIGWVSMNRTSEYRLEDDIQWGDEVFPPAPRCSAFGTSA